MDFVENTRTSFKESDDRRDTGLKVPDNMIIHDNISYGPYGKENLLDVYYTNDTSKCQKTIISIHGGAWVYGSKDLYKFYCMDLAQRGFTVVNFNYRLAPESKYPSAIEDINAVFLWILENGHNYCIDTDNLFVVGDSAGAQLSSQYLALITNKDYQKLFDLNFPSQIKIKGAALNCGLYDTGNYDYVFDSDDLIKAYLGENISDEIIRSLNTLKYVTKNFPSSIVMTSYNDFLKPHAQPMYEFLKKAGVQCEYKIYGAPENKDIAHVFHLNIRINEAKKCNDYECEFFNKLAN